MELRDVLRVKGSSVFAIAPTATLGDVVSELMRHRCGALLVCAHPEIPSGMVGIISERDILRACADRSGSINQVHLSDYMSMDLVTGEPGDSIEYALNVMTDHRVRHLPVLEGDRLVGLVSIGDLVKALHHQTAVENHYLKSYIQS
jgi:CBS domain-containing protein